MEGRLEIDLKKKPSRQEIEVGVRRGLRLDIRVFEGLEGNLGCRVRIWVSFGSGGEDGGFKMYI